MRAFGVIPVRKGSKRLPGKNLLRLEGKTLIARTVGTGLASGVFSKVLLSTDCEEMAREGAAAGAWVPFMRPVELAQDNTSSLAVLLQALEFLDEAGEKPEVLCLMQATSPFLKPEQLRGGFEQFIEGHYHSLSSAYEVGLPLEWQWEVSQGKASPVNREKFECPAGHFPKRLMENGAFYFVKAEHLRSNKSLYNLDNHGLYAMPFLDSVDVDNLEDFKLAQVVAALAKQN
jgi:CMP-N-acetylneuraminic acid synthetase